MSDAHFVDVHTCYADMRRYMVLFLKFIASVIPTVQYDFTGAAGGW